MRVGRTLHPGKFARISRKAQPLEKGEIYLVRVRSRIVLSLVLEKGSGTLLLLPDQGDGDIEVVQAQRGRVRSLVVGKVVAAIRPLQYSVVRPSGGGEK